MGRQTERHMLAKVQSVPRLLTRIVSCLYWITCCVSQGKVFFFPLNKSIIYQACLVKMATDIGLFLFWVFMNFDSVSDQKHVKKKELGQYPATFNSCLVNNPYYIEMESEWLMNMYLAASAGIAWLATSASNSYKERSIELFDLFL